MLRIFQKSYKTKIQLPAQMHLETQIQVLQFHFFLLFLSTFKNIIPDSILFFFFNIHLIIAYTSSLKMKIETKFYSADHVAVRHSAMLHKRLMKAWGSTSPIFDSRLMRSIICESMLSDMVAMENHSALRPGRLGSQASIPETRLLISRWEEMELSYSTFVSLPRKCMNLNQVRLSGGRRATAY